VENQNIRFGTPRTLAKEATENQTEGGALVVAQFRCRYSRQQPLRKSPTVLSPSQAGHGDERAPRRFNSLARPGSRIAIYWPSSEAVGVHVNRRKDSEGLERQPIDVYPSRWSSFSYYRRKITYVRNRGSDNKTINQEERENY
jgi:hypothetical protein